MANFFLDFNNGRGLQNGTTYADAASALSQFTSGPASGDIIRCAETPAYNTGLTATFNKQAITVTLSAGASALFKDIYMDGAWTGAANVTATADAVNKKQGSNAASMNIAGAFTTGQVAYYATGLLNLSAFNRISFWIKPSIAIAANTLRLDLCTDTIGAVASTSYTIPFAMTANFWYLVTTPDLGALSAVIQSINLQALLDPGATTVIIDNVIACTTSGLNLSSVIGLGDGWWLGLKSLTGTTMVLDNGEPSLQGRGRGHWNINGNHTGTFPLYAINPIQITASITGVTTAGTELSGGWDTSTMSTQSASGYTFLDRMSRDSFGFTVNAPKIHSRMGYARGVPTSLKLIDSHCSCTYQTSLIAPSTINGIAQPSAIRVRSVGGASTNGNGLFTVGSAGYLFQDSIVIGNDNVGWSNSLGSPPAWGTTYINCQAHNNGNAGFGQSPSFTLQTLINPIAFDNSNSAGIVLGNQNICFNALASGNSTFGLRLAAGARVYGAQTISNTIAGILYDGNCYIKNWTSTGEANKATLNAGTGCWLYSTEENGIIGSNHIYNGVVSTALPDSASSFCVAATGAGTYSGSGLAWLALFGTSAIANGLSATNPARVCVGRFYVESGKNATFSYQIARNSTTTVGGALRIFGGIQGGIGSYGNDIVTPVTSSAWATSPPTAGDYTQHSISTGTASESGVVEVWFEFWPLGAITGKMMIDSCTASQV